MIPIRTPNMVEKHQQDQRGDGCSSLGADENLGEGLLVRKRLRGRPFADFGGNGEQEEEDELVPEVCAEGDGATSCWGTDGLDLSINSLATWTREIYVEGGYGREQEALDLAMGCRLAVASQEGPHQ